MNLVITMIGGNCPVQAEGTVNGVPFYFRARGEHWSFSVGKDPVGIFADGAEGFYYEEPYGDSQYAAGWMPDDVARECILKGAALYAGEKR